MVKVSVIIPVYNVEPYLKQCMDSVVGQTLKDIEIICVDDGSTDNSLDILREYAAEDSRIQIIEQKNAGQGLPEITVCVMQPVNICLFWIRMIFLNRECLKRHMIWQKRTRRILWHINQISITQTKISLCR